MFIYRLDSVFADKIVLDMADWAKMALSTFYISVCFVWKVDCKTAVFLRWTNASFQAKGLEARVVRFARIRN